MKRPLKVVSVVISSLLLALFLAAGYWIYAPSPRSSPGRAGIQAGKIEVGGRIRNYLAYIPPREPHPALIFAFHGSGGSAAGMRILTGYRFEHLAETEGFIVVYPDGYKHAWNTCREAGSDPARTMNIDDLGFIEALLNRFQREHAVNPKRVFAMGLSLGGHMSFRLALERPDLVSAIAAAGANLPTPDNNVCHASGAAVPALLINGTEDPINPYEGGLVSMFRIWSRGTVISAKASAEYFALLGGAQSTGPSQKLPQKDARTWVERSVWRGTNNHEVVLFTVHGGGHVLPQSSYRYPRIMGATNQDLEGPNEIWEFFSRHAKG